MSKLENNISWCDETVGGAVIGCTEVSPGCARCYAKQGTPARVMRAGKWPRLKGRKVETWGPKGERVPVNFEPVFRRLNKLCICDECHESYPFKRIGERCDAYSFSNGGCGGKLRRIRLFADSNSDWLDEKWPVETLARFLDAIRLAPNIDTILLTKRVENFDKRLRAVLDANWNMLSEVNRAVTRPFHKWVCEWQAQRVPPSHVWLGVSVEDQKRADERIPLLLKTPAAVRFLSVEPLLESVELFGVGGGVKVPLSHPTYAPVFRRNKSERGEVFDTAHKFVRPDWVIVGSESGRNRRDCGVEAIESVVRQCVAAGIPVYCKQDSALLPGQRGRLSDEAWSHKEFP